MKELKPNAYQTLVSTFVDFKKAFDSINRKMLYAILLHYGIPEKIVEAIKNIYDESKASVSVNGKLSKAFKITTGVLQGDVLAPYLFIIVMDYVMNKSDCDKFGFIYKERESTRHPAKKISDLDYADDIALLETCIEHAKEQLAKLSEAAREVGLEINTDKTEYMTFNIPPEGPQLTLNGNVINRVDDFKYLGAKMASTESDIANRKSLAWIAFWKLIKIWRAPHIPLKLKLDIYQTAVLSILLYGSETWVLTKKLENEINTFGTKCYRQILNISPLSHTSNKTIYELTNREPLIVTVRKNQLRWVGHAMRLKNDEPAKIFALYEPAHKGKVGRPKLSYKRQIADLVLSKETPTGLITTTIENLAQNRINWKKLVVDCVKEKKNFFFKKFNHSLLK